MTRKLNRLTRRSRVRLHDSSWLPSFSQNTDGMQVLGCSRQAAAAPTPFQRKWLALIRSCDCDHDCNREETLTPAHTDTPAELHSEKHEFKFLQFVSWLLSQILSQFIIFSLLPLLHLLFPPIPPLLLLLSVFSSFIPSFSTDRGSRLRGVSLQIFQVFTPSFSLSFSSSQRLWWRLNAAA